MMERSSKSSGAWILLGALVLSGACGSGHSFGGGSAGSAGSGGASGSSATSSGGNGATAGSDASSGASVSTSGSGHGGSGGTDSTTSAGKSGESGGAEQGEAGAAAGGAASGESGAGGGSGGSASGGSASGGSASGGNAGTAGAGGGKGGLGAACNDKSQCASGNCADGVCCDGKCDGACQACSAQGKCNVKPADDAACGNISCPADTGCRDYPTAITTNRCAAFGVCKNSDNCSFNVKNQGITCDPTHVCDGAGNCGPVVVCGGTSCQIGPNECCAQTDKSIATCVEDGLTCADGSDPATPDTGMLIECDQTSDCPGGQACCWHSGRGSSGVFCKDSAQCVENGAQQYFEAIVCKTGAGSSTCPTGSCTGDVGGVTGWKYCE